MSYTEKVSQLFFELGARFSSEVVASLSSGWIPTNWIV